MATIHLLVGFIGFGKTTIAKRMEKELGAKRLTHDDIMVERFGRNPIDFQEKYKIVDEFIKTEAKKCILDGNDVIMDYGFWSHQKREEYYQWARNFTSEVVFHVLECDINEAKARVLKRSEKDCNALMIDENMFDILLKQYEPWSIIDNYPVIFYNTSESYKYE